MITMKGTDITRKPSVLLVEHDDATAVVLGYMLQSEGYEVTRVADEKQVCNVINSNHVFSLVLLDVIIPHKSCVDLMSVIRSTPYCNQMPVIMISGVLQGRDIADALMAGANDYVVRPFVSQEVLTGVHNSIARSY